eukprot:6445000-Pyramimonas_sp.AAC.1
MHPDQASLLVCVCVVGMHPDQASLLVCVWSGGGGRCGLWVAAPGPLRGGDVVCSINVDGGGGHCGLWAAAPGPLRGGAVLRVLQGVPKALAGRPPSVHLRPVVRVPAGAFFCGLAAPRSVSLVAASELRVTHFHQRTAARRRRIRSGSDCSSCPSKARTRSST